jgi:hypothetical protein
MQNAELDVGSLQDETKPVSDEKIDQETLELERALAIAVVKVYNDKLRERFRKKRIVQEHGLINFHLHLAARYRYDSTLTHHVCECLSVFSQVFKFQEHCSLFERFAWARGNAPADPAVAEVPSPGHQDIGVD